jgi:hypothetical protein
VRREILPEHNIAWLQRRTQDSADPTAKDVPIDGPVDDPWRVEPLKAQRREQRIMAPLIVWDMIDHPLPGGGTTIAADHRQGDTRFIHEFQPVDVEGVNRRAERGAERLDALGLPL